MTNITAKQEHVTRVLGQLHSESNRTERDEADILLCLVHLLVAVRQIKQVDRTLSVKEVESKLLILLQKIRQ